MYDALRLPLLACLSWTVLVLLAMFGSGCAVKATQAPAADRVRPGQIIIWEGTPRDDEVCVPWNPYVVNPLACMTVEELRLLLRTRQAS